MSERMRRRGNGMHVRLAAGAVSMLGIGLLAAGCAGLRQDSAFERPVVLFWCAEPEKLTHITHVTPQADLELDGKSTNPAHLVSAWQERGVTPLRWKGGWCYKERTEDEFFSDFEGAVKQGHVGIAIDEWGGGDKEFDAKFGRALVRFKEAYPDFFVAVWCFGLFRPRQAEWLREGADLVMVERYFSGSDPEKFKARFDGVISTAREAGIIQKTVFALGINDLDKPENVEKYGYWANSPEELEAQMRYIHEAAPEMPGISFFAPRCSEELRRFADEKAAEIFGK